MAEKHSKTHASVFSLQIRYWTIYFVFDVHTCRQWNIKFLQRRFIVSEVHC